MMMCAKEKTAAMHRTQHFIFENVLRASFCAKHHCLSHS